jgi:hypothetical protein
MKDASPEKSALAKPLIASLSLHACLLIGIYYSTISMQPIDQNRTVNSNSIDIILVERNPQIALIEEETEIEVEVLVAENPAEILVEMDSVEAEVIDTNIEENSSLSEAIVSVPNGGILAPPPDQEFEFDQSPSAENTLNEPEISSAEVSLAISTYMASYSQELNQEWLTECIKYRTRHGSKECPEGLDSSSYSSGEIGQTITNLFANQQSTQARQARNLEDRTDFLAGIMGNYNSSSTGDQFVRELIEGQYYLERDRYYALTGTSRRDVGVGPTANNYLGGVIDIKKAINEIVSTLK